MKTKILNLAIVLTLGIILTGSLIAPVVSDAQKDLGDPITLTNESRIVLRAIEDGDELQLVRTIDDDLQTTDAWYLNNEQISGISGNVLDWNVGLISDAWYVQIYAASTISAVAYKMNTSNPDNGKQEIGGTSSTPTQFVSKFTATDGSIIYTSRTGTQQSIPYTWGYVICNYEDGTYYSSETNGTGICKSADDLILCGAYTSGDLDTMYAYINGNKYVSNSAYELTVNDAVNLHAGTSDIYDLTATATISDGETSETFTPYRIFLPYEVSGHATSGAAYSLLGAIPILVVVALLMIAIGAIAVRRND